MHAQVIVSLGPRAVRRRMVVTETQLRAIAEALLDVGLARDWSLVATEVCRHQVGGFEVTYEVIPARRTLKVVTVAAFFPN